MLLMTFYTADFAEKVVWIWIISTRWFLTTEKQSVPIIPFSYISFSERKSQTEIKDGKGILSSHLPGTAGGELLISDLVTYHIVSYPEILPYPEPLAVSGVFLYHIRAFLNIFRKLQSYSRMFWSYPESYYHIRSLSHIQKIVYLISLVIAESFTVSGIRDHIRNFLLYPVFMIVSKSFSPFHTVKVQESCVTILYFSRVKCEKQYTIYPFYIIYLKRKFIS
jgi:hypothetical protein